MPKKNNPGCLCCNKCKIVADNFNRADSGSLGSAWSVESGTWAIDTNTLEASSTSAAILTVAAHPDGAYSGVVECTLLANTSGNRARIILDAIDDDNYHFAEIIVNGASSRVDLYKRTTGSNTLLVTGTTFTLLAAVSCTVKVCLNDTLLIAYVDGTHRNYYPDIVPHGGDRAGLGTGSTVSGSITIDDFQFSKHESSELPTCPACTICTTCSGDRTPLQVQAVVSGIVANRCNLTLCNKFNGTFIMYYSPSFCESSSIGSPTDCYWESADITSACELGLTRFGNISTSCTTTSAMSARKPHWTLRKRSNGDAYLWINENSLQDWGLGSFGFYPNFQKTGATACDTWSSYSLTPGPAGTSPTCAFSSATATITSL